ncbi:ABC transporter permease [Microbacterium sp. NPDC076895]|uniref:ABC transporter permease n=1 Tax=Microbacterium sp. NPDC076895 TaxID=3154957 RepID=UPI00342E595A
MDAHLSSSSYGLSEVGQRPPLGSYLAEAWRRRTFAFTFASYSLFGGLVRNRLGILWIVLKPLLIALIYGTIFGVLLSNAARPADFIPYVITGVFVFEYFTGSFGNAARSITGNAKLVQSLGFPRILLPISVVIEQTMRIVPILVLLGILLLVFGVPLAWSWLLVIPIMIMMGMFNLGAGLIVARMSVTTRDVQQLIPVINRFLLYASAIFFQVDVIFADNPVILTVAHLIPTYDYIALVRGVMLTDHPAPLLALVAAPVWAVVVVTVGVLYFWGAEARYGLSD